jgi:hypothetical protein
MPKCVRCTAATASAGRQDEAGPGNEIVFSQHKVSGEITSSPAVQQGGNRRAELIEEITELNAFLGV